MQPTPQKFPHMDEKPPAPAPQGYRVSGSSSCVSETQRAAEKMAERDKAIFGGEHYITPINVVAPERPRR